MSFLERASLLTPEWLYQTIDKATPIKLLVWCHLRAHGLLFMDCAYAFRVS